MATISPSTCRRTRRATCAGIEAGGTQRAAVQRQHQFRAARHVVVGDIPGAGHGAHDGEQRIAGGAQFLRFVVAHPHLDRLFHRRATRNHGER